MTETWHATIEPDSTIDGLTWCRIYHRDRQTPNGHTGRRFGPLHRFDHHQPDAASSTPGPRIDPDGRSVIYVGEDLITCVDEVFGETEEARLCPGFRVAGIAPITNLSWFDLQAPGAARAVGALPALGSGNEKRSLTQEWARAIFEDHPTGTPLDGLLYRSAYQHGLAAALWDCDAKVRTSTDSAGQLWDRALRDPRVLPQLMVLVASTPITVTLIEAADCSRCT